jgi:hypothetical protein
MDNKQYTNEFNEARSHVLRNKKTSRIKECFFKNKDCSEKIIDAHSISQSTLNLIKDYTTSGEKVIVLSDIKITKDGVVNIPSQKGWSNEASIFNGFCGVHDREIFKPIENSIPFDNTDIQCFLHSYRAFAYSYHKQKENEKFGFSIYDDSLNIIENPLNDFFNLLNSKNENSQNATKYIEVILNLLTREELSPESFIDVFKNHIPNYNQLTSDELIELKDQIKKSEEYISFLKIRNEIDKKTLYNLKKNGLQGLITQLYNLKEKKVEEKTFSELVYEPAKEKLNHYLNNHLYNKLKFTVRIKRNIFPLVSTGMFLPKIIDPNATFIKVIPTNELISPIMFLTVIPDKFNRTIIIISCFKDDPNACIYLDKLNSLKSETEFEKAISGIIFNSCAKNTFINPKLWDKICFNDEDKLIAKEIIKKRPFDKLDEKPYLSKINLFDEKNKLENIE